MDDDFLPVEIGEVWEYDHDPNFVFMILDIVETEEVASDYATDGLSIYNNTFNIRVESGIRYGSVEGINDYTRIGKVEKLKINGEIVLIGENDE